MILIPIAATLEYSPHILLIAILALFLRFKLGYSEDDATVIFHGFIMAVYFLCIFGGIVSDVWLGKFKSILYLSIVYSIGCAIVAISAIPNINASPKATLFVGLVLIAVGTGGIKPSVAAFGGDQFKLPEQAKHSEQFFSVYYFVICLGSLLATTVTPIFRQEVQCFGESDCFSLAFALPAIMMPISIRECSFVFFFILYSTSIDFPHSF